MKSFFVAAVIGFAAARVRLANPEGPCRLPITEPIEYKIKAPLAPSTDLPEQWLWNDVNGTNFLTNVRNQHVPQYCGSCWAHAATSSFSDRIKIARNAQWPDINIAPQVLIDCEHNSLGCHGGNAMTAYKWMSNNEITDETCSIYTGRGLDNGGVCSPMTKCRNCNPGEACFVPDEYYVYQTEEFGPVSGEVNMMEEIYQRGPIACGVAVPESLELYTGGVYCDDTGDVDIVHDISVVGYGVTDDGEKYWTVRNSWGTHWGENGFFRVCRGVNNIAIESECAWTTPKDTWTEAVKHVTTEDEKENAKNDKIVYDFPQPLNTDNDVSADFLPKQEAGCRVPVAEFEGGELKTSPHAWDVYAPEDLPANVDWRNMDGVNYMSWSKNQHIPRYCGSCWAQGSTSAIADRFNILTGLGANSPVGLNAQVVVNCQEGGSCNGGNPAKVYKYANKEGLVHSSCEQYSAYNLQHDCSAIDVCKECTWPPPKADDDGQEGCFAVEPNMRYYVSEYYKLSGVDQMKAELYANGPISCGVHATDLWEETYFGGIYSEHVAFPLINHEISVVGYGYDEESDREFWIGRNSWGSYWGEYGFFRVQMYSDNLGIEKDCIAGTPTFEKPAATEYTQ